MNEFSSEGKMDTENIFLPADWWPYNFNPHDKIDGVFFFKQNQTKYLSSEECRQCILLLKHTDNIMLSPEHRKDIVIYILLVTEVSMGVICSQSPL